MSRATLEVVVVGAHRIVDGLAELEDAAVCGLPNSQVAVPCMTKTRTMARFD